MGFALLLGVGGLTLTGCHRGDDTSNATPTPPAPGIKPGTAVSSNQTGAPPTGGPAVRPGPMGKGPGIKPGGKPLDPFAPGAGAAAPGGAAPGMQVAAMPHRKDPFYVTWHVLPPPPDPLASGELQPIRVASAGYMPPPEKEVTVREVPDRRVSGIMSGDGVFAIIEQNGESEVVKPGGTTKDGYRVVAINDDSVKLQKKVGNLNYTQTVQLSDVQTGAPTQTYGRPGGFGPAGYPGMGPGLGRPGAGRPGGVGGVGGGGSGGNKAD